MASHNSTMKAFNLCNTVFWIAKLNAAWLAGTLLGAVILGLGPSTTAAFDCARRQQRGDPVSLQQVFRAAYTREFARANLLTLPVMFVAAMLFLNWQYASSPVLATGLIVVGLLFAGSVCVLFPMFAHYELRLGSYYVTASRFAVRYLPGTTILLFVLSTITFVSYLIPGLLLFFSFGVWIYLDSYLCGKLFEQNEANLNPQLVD